MRIAALTALVFACLSLTGPAAAAPALADCNDPVFKKEAGSDAGFDCTEIARQTLKTNGGDIVIRAVRDKTTDPQLVTQQAALSIEATAESFALYDKLGLGFKFRNITLVMIDPVLAMTIPWREKASSVLADANGFTFETDCIVRVAIGTIEGEATDDASLNYRNTLAHELMHCVQYWTWRQAAALYCAEGACNGAEWWMEGTAEFFAHLVFESPQRALAWGADFDKSWASDKPLTRMRYENIVFFAWVWQQGPNAMLDFFATLATTKGEAAQQDGLRTAFSDEALTRFVQDYTDSKVALPSGSVVFKAWQGQPQLIDGDEVISFDRQPFQIERKSLLFTNGVYNVYATGMLDWTKRPIDGGEWTPIDPTVEIDACKKPVVLVAARLRTMKYNASIVATRNKSKTCEPCITLAEHDKCLVGTWAIDADAVQLMLEGWRQDANMNTATFNLVTGSAFIVFDATGDMQLVFEDYRTSASVVQNTGGSKPILARINVSISGIDQAKWTSSGMDLAACPFAQGTEITSKVEIEGGPSTEVKQTGILQNAMFSYVCQGNSLAMQFEGETGGHEKPKWQLTKVK